jgi:hypothetical protein
MSAATSTSSGSTKVVVVVGNVVAVVVGGGVVVVDPASVAAGEAGVVSGAEFDESSPPQLVLASAATASTVRARVNPGITPPSTVVTTYNPPTTIDHWPWPNVIGPAKSKAAFDVVALGRLDGVADDDRGGEEQAADHK